MAALARSTTPRRGGSIRFQLSVMGRPVVVEAEAPERARFDQLLPALRALENAVVEAAVANIEAEGERVSCAKGCSTCCKRQLVPVTPPEALALSRLVDRLPEPRRSAVRAAFARAVETLKAAGLYDIYMTPEESDPSRDRGLARRYMALELHCPFLEDEACGIYADRPIVCRQYLVTSPPAYCEDPAAFPVKGVPIPFGLPRAFMRVMQARTGRTENAVPLVLALDYAATRRGDLGRKHDSREMIGDLFGALTTRG